MLLIQQKNGLLLFLHLILVIHRPIFLAPASVLSFCFCFNFPSSPPTSPLLLLNLPPPPSPSPPPPPPPPPPSPPRHTFPSFSLLAFLLLILALFLRPPSVLLLPLFLLPLLLFTTLPGAILRSKKEISLMNACFWSSCKCSDYHFLVSFKFDFIFNFL